MTLKTPAVSVAHWGTPDAVCARLEGEWSLRRTFTNGASMSGIAVFAPSPDGLLRYHEEGRVRLPDGKTFDGHRDYFFAPAPNGFTVYFAESPRREFHRIEIEPGADGYIGKAAHLCVADHYDSCYRFRPDGSFEIEHTVAGPRKDYASHTVFVRKA